MSEFKRTLIAGGHQTGKTEQLLDWVSQGEPSDSYPFWSRVIFTPTMAEADRLRKILRDRFPEHDAYRWVFFPADRPRFQMPLPEIGVDRLEGFVAPLFPGPVSVFAMAIDRVVHSTEIVEPGFLGGKARLFGYRAVLDENLLADSGVPAEQIAEEAAQSAAESMRAAVMRKCAELRSEDGDA